ncbi:hypothetical protein GCM10022242_06470 [Nocardioides panacisoli]|uniref:Putative Flp pilus-assembly TadG-like N-terminal domain-containing protein n=1 Tax=Nocardioides panacisoli TaxID=627624 RepID=A0ABP7I0P9_9ACTN
MGLLLPILMVSAAFVVDLGMARVTRSDLQAAADVVALDLAREMTGKTQAQLAPAGDWSNPNSAVRKAAARTADNLLGNGLEMSVDWGSYTNGIWNTTTDPPSAVRVTAQASGLRAFSSKITTVDRAAVAVASSTACYRLGSFVASVDTSDSTIVAPLNDLLGVNLDLVSYKALAAAKVRLGDLAADPTIGSPQALLTGSLSYSTLIQAMITVLSKDQANSVAVSALRTILNVAPTLGSITLGNVLHVAPTDTAALDIAMNVLDVVGSATLSNGQHFLSIPNLQAGVPGVGFQFTGALNLISAAQLACGAPNSAAARAHNSQLDGDIGIVFTNLPSLNTAALGTLQTAKGTATIAVHIGNADGQLVAPPDVHCGANTGADPTTMSVSVASLLSTYTLDIDLDVNGSVKLTDLLGLGLTSVLTNLLGVILPNKIDIDVGVHFRFGTTAQPTTSTANLQLPPNDVTPVSTGTSVYLDPNSLVPSVTSATIGGKTAVLSSVTALTSPILSALTTGNNNFVDKTLLPLLDNLNNGYIGPVARMVGLRFGGADVYAVGATCASPSLRE